MIYVAALLLAVFAGSIPALANSPWDPREMEPKVDPLIEGEDQNNSGKPGTEGHPIETE